MARDQSKKDPSSKQPNHEKALGPLSEGAETPPVEGQDTPLSALTNHLNLEEIRLPQDFASAVGVKKLLTTVPIRKPGKQTFSRVHPDPAYQLDTMVLELEEEGETYLVMPHLYAELGREITPKRLYTCITKQGVCFLWPIKLPGEDGRLNSWPQSALEAAEIGKEKWIRVKSNKSLGAYEVFEATATFPDPKWPDVTFEELVTLAFKEKVINDLEHPIVRQLRGAN